MPIDKVNSTSDSIEVCVADDFDELIDAPLGVNVLDVGLVLVDQAVQCQGVQPHSIIHITNILGRVDSIVSTNKKTK